MHDRAHHLIDLNEGQLTAVRYGVGESRPHGPLLIIAGAGTGKTKTLAHRVAHLILNGADPRRILLLTFTRRAAQEMRSRVERICAAALGEGGRAGAALVGRGGVGWAGTFHSVGARLLRAHARNIGLDPAFTIADREDA